MVGLVQCTSPFVGAEDLQEACQKMMSGFDSVFSVRRCHSLRWLENDVGEFDHGPNSILRARLISRAFFVFSKFSGFYVKILVF